MGRAYSSVFQVPFITDLDLAVLSRLGPDADRRGKRPPRGREEAAVASSGLGAGVCRALLQGC